jgi:universal stress protein A
MTSQESDPVGAAMNDMVDSILPAEAGSAEIKRILVPVDFSDSSKAALAQAQALAKAFNAALDLVYVDEHNYGEIASFGPMDVDLFKEQAAKENTKKLSAVAERLQELGFKSTAVVKTGRAPLVIAELAKEMAADLIVIATHGHTGLQHLVLGSTAENVVRHAPCPVLTVRASG